MIGIKATRAAKSMCLRIGYSCRPLDDIAVPPAAEQCMECSMREVSLLTNKMTSSLQNFALFLDYSIGATDTLMRTQ